MKDMSTVDVYKMDLLNNLIKYPFTAKCKYPTFQLVCKNTFVAIPYLAQVKEVPTIAEIKYGWFKVSEMRDWHVKHAGYAPSVL